MPDFELIWGGHDADLSIVDDDLSSDHGMRTAILLSIFSDRLADLDDDIPSGDGDRRGWIGDDVSEIQGDRFGSKLWLLSRVSIHRDIETVAKRYIEDALRWMIDDLVASDVIVNVVRVRDGITINVEVVRPNDDRQSFRFAHVWDPPVTVPKQEETGGSGGGGGGPTSPVFPATAVDWASSFQSILLPDAIYIFDETLSPIADRIGTHQFSAVPSNADILYAEAGPSGPRLNIGLKANLTDSLVTSYLQAAADAIPGPSNDGHFMTADGIQKISGTMRCAIDSVGRVVAHISNGFVATPQQGWSVDVLADRIQLRWKVLGGTIYTADVLGNFADGVERMVGWVIDSSTATGSMQLFTSLGNSPSVSIGNDRNDDELFTMRLGSIFADRAKCSFRYMALWSNATYALTANDFASIDSVVGI